APNRGVALKSFVLFQMVMGPMAAFSGQEGFASPRHSRSTHAIGLSVRCGLSVRGTGAALLLPACNTEAMQLHLNEIATKVSPGAPAIVLPDQADWQKAKPLKSQTQGGMWRHIPDQPAAQEKI